MKHDHNTAPINMLSLQPESGQWIAVAESSHRASHKIKRKLLITAILISAFCYFYNPIATFKPKPISLDEVSGQAVDIAPKVIQAESV